MSSVTPMHDFVSTPEPPAYGETRITGPIRLS